jgi:protein Mpv17
MMTCKREIHGGVMGKWMSLLVFAIVSVNFMSTVSALPLGPAGALERGWVAYKSALSSRPIITKSVTSAVIMSVSDAITQRVEAKLSQPDSKKKDDDSGKAIFVHNWLRTSHVAITGMVYSGPITHYWYQILELIVTVENRVLGLACRMLLDSIIFTPVTITGYFTVRTFLDQQGLVTLRTKLQTKLKPALFAAWSFWPPVNIFNFSLVPLQFRVLYSNVMSLVWTGYLSFVNQKKEIKHSD